MERNKRKNALPLVVVIAVLLAFSSPASADYSGDMPLIIYDYDTIKGGVIYNTTEAGDKYVCLDDGDTYSIAMSQNLTVSIPDGATVKTARLYNYYTWSDPGDGNIGVPAQAWLSFSNGTDTWSRICMHGCTPDNRSDCPNPIDYENDVIQYWDTKSQKYTSKIYDFPGGTFAWNVTPYVTGSGTYTAEIRNAKEVTTGDERFCTVGFGLLVVYENPSSPEIEYWIGESCDLLMNRTGFETAENATTNATFNSTYASLFSQGFQIPCACTGTATLSTILCFIDGQNRVFFNDHDYGASTPGGVFHITYDEYNDAGDYLAEGTFKTDNNVVKIQDRGDYESVHNAFLVVNGVSYVSKDYSGTGTETIYWDEAGVKISFDYSDLGWGFTLNLLKYKDNPYPPFPVRELSRYFNVSVNQWEKLMEWPIRVEMSYTDAEISTAGIDESTLGIYYWNETWKKCSDTGVYTGNNTIWANIKKEELVWGIDEWECPLGSSPLNAGGESSSPEKPDLVITDKWVCWPDNCTICYNITNEGNGTAPAGHNTTLYVDGNETAQDEVPVDLAPNASYIGCFDGYSWTYTPLEDSITVCADNNNTVDEGNETNNCLTNIWECGDVDGDGSLTITDARIIVGKMYGQAWCAGYPDWPADVDCDKSLTITDARIIVGKMYGQAWCAEYNCCCISG